MDGQLSDADALDLARKVTANREARREAMRITRDGLKSLGTGETLVVPLPIGEPAHRDTYKGVNAAASRLLGAGLYKLRCCNGNVVITCLAR